MKKASVLLVAIALALFGLAACGDDDDDGDETVAAETTTEAPAADGGAETVELSSPPDAGLAYDRDSLQASAGTITINYDNQQDLSHDVVIEDESDEELAKTDLISGAETSTTVDLQPGTYTYYCDVPGHREGGMEGTLTVE